MVLFINGCVRQNSRTLELAKAVLAKETGDVQEVCLYSDGPEGLTTEKLCQREKLLEKRSIQMLCSAGQDNFLRQMLLCLRHHTGI